MNVLEQLYTDVAQFREYSPYTESNISFSDLSSSALSAVKQVVSMLSKPIYDSLLKNDDEKKTRFAVPWPILRWPSSLCSMCFRYGKQM